METNNKKNNEISKKEAKSENENLEEIKKNEIKNIEKNYIELLTEERANLKQYAKRKYIATKALKQIHSILLFDRKKTMTIVMEEVGISHQTLKKWREQFKISRMNSLIVILEKKKEGEKRTNIGDIR